MGETKIYKTSILKHNLRLRAKLNMFINDLLRVPFVKQRSSVWLLFIQTAAKRPLLCNIC